MEGLVRGVCEDGNQPLNAHEKRLVEAKLDDYYEKNWTHVIISILQMKNPLVANAHTLSALSTKVDEYNKMYFEVGWLKPGRHVFVVEHDEGGAILDDTQVYEQRLNKFMADKMR